MYKTTLTKEELAYNLAYHLEKETDKPTHEVIMKTLAAYEEKPKKASKTLDND